jgi:hypothetical protein
MEKNNLNVNQTRREYIPTRSILEICHPFFKQNSTGYILIDELFIYYNFYDQKLMMRKDRNECQKFVKRGGKLMLLSLFIGGVINRFLTLSNPFNMNKLRFIFRLPIRLLVYSLPLYFVFYSKSFEHFILLRDKLNEEYIPRFKRFQRTGDTLLMNPYILEEAETEDDKEYISSIIERNKKLFKKF